MITSNEIDFSPQSSTAVISGAQKFILPVPAFADGGEPLVYPDGDKAGQPVVDREGRKISGRGIVFHNDDVVLHSVLLPDNEALLAEYFIDPGASYEIVIPATADPLTYNLVCTIHLGMQGTLQIIAR